MGYTATRGLVMAFFSLVGAGCGSALDPSDPGTSEEGTQSAFLSQAMSHRRVCGSPRAGSPQCSSRVVTDDSGNPVARSGPSGYGPNEFVTAYALPSVAPSGQTIGITLAFLQPDLEADLGVYSQQFGLPACTQANGCLKIVQACRTFGQKKHPTTVCPTIVDSGWRLEAALDVEIAHGICPTCTIVVALAVSNNFDDLANAQGVAVQNGATVLSNSWGAPEWSAETQFDASWTHPGIPNVFASGDSGYGAFYPSASPAVVSAGGTTLTLNRKDNTYRSESAWSGAGSHCSLYEFANSWQTALPNWAATGCGNARAAADVSADADPSTGAAIYDSIPYAGRSGWFQVGGTSLATPILAGLFALAGGGGGVTNPSSIPYARFTSANSHDITSGTNGSCGTIMCAAGVGYDGPTGLGSPMGIGGF